MKRRFIHVRVTAYDIEQGTPEDSHSCPIALALSRTYQDVTVDSITAILDHSTYVDLSPRAQHFVAAFDDGLDVEPSVFRLAVRA